MGKFQPTGESPIIIINNMASKAKREDALTLLEMHERISGYEAVVWYPGVIGFGQYHYRYESGVEGDMPFIAFAPRQNKFSLYIDQQLPNRADYLAKLGKHKQSVGCVYINKLSDIDCSVLEEMLACTMTLRQSKEQA